MEPKRPTTGSSRPEPSRPGTVGRNPTGDRPADGSLSKDFRIGAPSVSLPKGGGAISGMGEKFAANPVTGTASLSIPLPITPGRGGFTPALSLSYDSGGGNGPFGLGWRLSQASVRRKTDKGLPRYRDSGEDADTYIMSDVEDLIPMLAESGGTWSTVTRSETLESVAYTVARYRPRIEGSFAVIERWRRVSDGRIHWRSVARDNTRRIYGMNDQARLIDPDDSKRVFEWLIEEERDERGNVISYQYVAEDRAGVAAHPAEARRDTAGNSVAYRYLKRASYANTEMGHNPDLDEGGAFRFHLVFDYGDHDADDPGIVPDQTWPARQDAFSNFRARFDVRCYRLCQRVLMFHSFTSLRSEVVESETHPVPVVVKALSLTYTERPTVSTLDSAQLTGWSWNGTDYDAVSMPSLSLVYVEPEIDETVQLVDGLDDLPAGLDTRAWSWVDLDGEGLTGLLTEQGGTWFYKRNEGGGALGRAKALGSRPNVSIGAGARLVDLDGDGNLDVVVTRPGVAGFYARDPAGTWESFRSFRQIPTTGLDDPNARLIDLDGDGHADLLISGDTVFTWYPSEARDGFGPPSRVAQAANEDKGPRLLFSAQGEQIFLADMTGDGLTDLVRILNGNVCYWPNRGYGRFGAKVQMKGAPRFDRPDRFDPSRIRLTDVDGSGPTDLLYIGPEGVQIWYNQSGNGFSEATTLTRFPAVAWPNEVQVADLRGDGTACLVWSSPLLSQAHRPLRYVHLMKNGKPWLLASMTNGLGRETRLTYTASTAFYVADRRAGTPWATRLPFPVHCLSKVESLDHVTGWRFVQEYAYHHGYFDGPEREFRGFGLVEQWDTETLHDYEDEGNADPEALVTVPPVRTKTWFHTGAWRREQTLTDAYKAEYFAGDEPHEGEEDNEGAHHLTMPAMPSGLKPAELRDSHRALKGRPLRVEVYAEDGEGNLATLYTTAESTYSVVRLQPMDGETSACFRVDPCETLSYSYDSAVDAESFDPRVSHTLVLEVDPYGTVLRSAAVGYPRRGEGYDDEQTALTVVVSEVEVIHQDDRDAWGDPWHIGVPKRSQSWELTEISETPEMAWTDNGDPATVEAVEAALYSVTDWKFHETPSGSGFHRRLLAHQVTLYWNDALDAPLSVDGPLGERALVYERYALAMPEGLIEEVFDTLVGTTELENGGYVDLLEDGDAWLPSGRLILDDAAFYQLIGHHDPWGNTSAFIWDADTLAITEATDALGLTVAAEINYQLLSPSKVTDPNGTESEATFDALGRVTATFVRNDTDGDGTDPGDESARYTYETDRWTEEQLPTRVHVELREAHGGSDWLESYAYSDGGGQVIQTVTEAEPDGETERWIASGRVEIDNKGNVIRQYEPFYTASEEFDFSPAGVSAVLEYDPVGRNTKMTLPDETFRTWIYGPWEVSAADENDNSSSGVVGDHADTPTVTALDSLGRAYKIVELIETEGTPLITALGLDIQGNPRTVTDPRGNVIQIQTFDMLGRPLFTGAADEGYDPDSPGTDKGQTRALPDVASQPFLSWRSGDLALKQTYDLGRRPLALYVTEDSTTRLVTLTIYGDALSDTPSASFAKGRPLHVYDTAGRVTLAYDFRGRTVEQTRQVFEDIETQADWDGLEEETSLTAIETWLGGLTEPLDTEEFTITTAYDALDRVTEKTTPDGSVLTPSYDAGGRLQTVSAEILSTNTDFVTDITYNARGQRESIVYGNHTSTTTTYDPNRFWPTRILTERDDTGTLDDAILQDLNFERDPVGNIIEITDDAQETEFFSNAQVSPTREFAYDALYRLTSATGREKVAQTQTTAWYSVYAGTAGSVPDATNPALRSYTQSYTYDEAGNLAEMAHVPSSGTSWRRGYAVAAKHNQLLKSSIFGNDPDDPDTFSDLYTYNDRGAMTFMPHLKAGAGDNLTRDFRDQIRRADTDSAGTIAHYAYDASGQRVRKVVVKGSVVEERIYLGSYEVWRKRSTGTLVQERQTLHIMDGQRRIAMVETLSVNTSPPPSVPNTRIRYQLDDHLGTASLETDEDGGVISYEEYHPYGSTAWYADDGSLEASPKRFRYTGMERDDETGLQYHSARYYAPWLGRWTSADPVGLGDGVNRCSYCHGQPIRGRDPTGRADEAMKDPVDPLPDDCEDTPASPEWTSHGTGPRAFGGETSEGDLVSRIEEAGEHIEEDHARFPKERYGYSHGTPLPTDPLVSNCTTQVTFNLAQVLPGKLDVKLRYLVNGVPTDVTERDAGLLRVDGPLEGRLFSPEEVAADPNFLITAMKRGDERAGGHGTALVKAGLATPVTSLSDIRRNTVLQVWKFVAPAAGETVKWNMSHTLVGTGPVTTETRTAKNGSSYKVRALHGISANTPEATEVNGVIPAKSVGHKAWDLTGTVLIGTSDGLRTLSGQSATLVPGVRYTVIYGANLR